MGSRYHAQTAGIAYLHLVFWGSLVTFILAIYMVAAAPNDSVLRPCIVLLMLSVSNMVSNYRQSTDNIKSSLALSFILLHEYNTRHRQLLDSPDERLNSIKRPVYIAIRLAISVAILSLFCSGWNVVTATRQPICLPIAPMRLLWQAGGPCKAQRVAAAFSIINLYVVALLTAPILN